MGDGCWWLLASSFLSFLAKEQEFAKERKKMEKMNVHPGKNNAWTVMKKTWTWAIPKPGQISVLRPFWRPKLWIFSLEGASLKTSPGEVGDSALSSWGTPSYYRWEAWLWQVRTETCKQKLSQAWMVLWCFVHDVPFEEFNLIVSGVVGPTGTKHFKSLKGASGRPGPCYIAAFLSKKPKKLPLLSMTWCFKASNLGIPRAKRKPGEHTKRPPFTMLKPSFL